MRTLSLCLLAASTMLAQSPLGSVTGIAADASGALVPRAEVKLVSESTGIELRAITNDSGVYLFPNLAPGSYRLTASAPGFRPFETTPFALQAYRTVRQDIRFEVAGAAAEVTVSEAASSLVQSETSAISNRLGARQLAELPSNLRSVFNNAGDSGLIFQLMPLTIPGIVQMQGGAFWLTPGGTPNTMKLKVDGIDTTFGLFGSPDPVSQPSFESVEEFAANITGNKAEFGGLGVVTSVTKSGANRFHGGLFWFARNSAFDARNTFVAARPYQNIHNFGLNFSGPLIKNKTFFFLNWDQTRGSRAYLFSPSVPPIAWRTGDLSAVAGVIRNPITGQPYDGNRIPVSQISPVAQAVQRQFYPEPNFGAPTLAAANYRAAFNGPETHSILEARLDHNWTARHSTFGRYQFKRSDYDIPGVRGALPPQSTGTSENFRSMNFFTAGDTFTISPAMFNEFRAGVVALTSGATANLRGDRLLDQFGIRGLPARTVNGIPNLTIAGLSTVSMLLLNPVNDAHWQVSDNLTYIRGRHTYKAGFEFVRWLVNRYYPVESGTYGNFNFSGRFSGNAYADFLLGIPNTVLRNDPFPTQYFRYNDFSWFVQDDWKVTPRLTLNLGLRYEYNQPASARDGNIYSFDIPSGQIIVPDDQSRRSFSPFFPANVPVASGERLGLNSSLRRTDSNNFAPRFGFSYALTPDMKTVLRGGWGLYYNHYSGAVGAFLAAGPYAVSTTANNNIVNGQPIFTFAAPFASAGTPSALNLNAVTQDLRNAYTMQYTLTVEREILRDLAVRISYIGSRGNQQVYQRNINQPVASTTPFSGARRPYPQFNNIIFADNGAYNSYNGLQTQVTKRFSKGFQFSSAWTWAKQLSEVDDTGNADLNTAIEDAYNRRRDRADVYSVPRHLWQNQALWELPLGKHRFLKGWQLSSIFNVSTGHWLNPQFAGADPAGTSATGGRPDLIREISYPRTTAQWYDRTAFAPLANNIGRFGNAARNGIQGPGYVIFNGGLQKSTSLERLGTVTFMASFQNILNRVNYGVPNLTTNNANGGVITSTHIFPAAGSARTGQLGLRWMF
jgi:hypothetical protein